MCLALGRSRGYTFSTSSSEFRPYITGSVFYVHESLSSGGSTGSANGFFFGGGGGVLIRAGSAVSVDLSAFLGPLNFGDISIDGTKVSGSSTSGTGLEIRAGILLDFGK